MEPWNNIEGRVVMVTGASSGLGRELCIHLAKAGCKVIAAARRTDRLKSLCEEINRSSDAGDFTNAPKPCSIAVAVELDIAGDGETIKLAVQKAWKCFGHIDALINNAGVRGGTKSSLYLSEEEWNNVVRTNLTGSWLVSKFVGLHMVKAVQEGCIINISSTSSLNRTQMHGSLAYASSKSGLNSMTKIMALELGKHNIRVNSIAPDIFRSEMTEGLMKKEWLKNVVERTIPLKAFLTPDPALTSLIHFLIHDSSKYVTGNIFIVDAGITLPALPLFSSL
ncbi:Short-chain type alcohol dehydrogenase [Heracleum sosnowskyi]|uniref:Short-chain type alcohol dehydrogenase n=1 Tax=Heracleum sosnowskyi TaxID=360622 RepID=A0AAD8JD07_9APIA|nr:Short-chain type alcohol dehydrogenase [Heracleum sosnowskyi]